MSNFCVTPPWYLSDQDAFNCYALEEERRSDLRALGVAIRNHPNGSSPYVQEALCQAYCKCSTDVLSRRDMEYLQDVVWGKI